MAKFSRLEFLTCKHQPFMHNKCIGVKQAVKTKITNSQNVWANLTSHKSRRYGHFIWGAIPVSYWCRTCVLPILYSPCLFKKEKNCSCGCVASVSVLPRS